jgi:hypothetical protein
MKFRTRKGLLFPISYMFLCLAFESILIKVSEKRLSRY